MKGCEYVVSLVGCSPPRFVKISDLWSDPRKDANHPANVQYQGVKNLLEASKTENVKKFVRLTGLAVGASPWNPVSILFSLLLSFSTYWNRKGEMLLRESGVDYSIIRPGGLKDVPRAREGTDKLFLASEAWGDKTPPFTTGISRADLADLCCLSLTDKRLSRATLRVNRMRPPTADNNYFEDPQAKSTWEELLDTVRRLFQCFFTCKSHTSLAPPSLPPTRLSQTRNLLKKSTTPSLSASQPQQVCILPSHRPPFMLLQLPGCSASSWAGSRSSLYPCSDEAP